MPSGSLMLSGTTLYGVTGAGGATGWGTIFRISTDGTGYEILRSSRSSVADDGAGPYVR